MARTASRTSPCNREDATNRLAHAGKFLEVAGLVEGLVADDEEYASVSASLAVLSGIASADAACCIALGRRSRSQNHHDAENLVEQLMPGGTDAAAQLRRLLSVKDTANYGMIRVSGSDLRGALRHARQLLSFAERIARS